MSAVLPPPVRAPAVERPQALCLDRSIEHLAVFFGDEASAAAALAELTALARDPRLAGSRLDLLGPADSAWPRFVRLMRPVDGPGAVPPWQRDAWLFALIGALAGGVTASVALVTGRIGTESLGQVLGLNLLAGVAGASLGALLSALAARLPPYGHFGQVLRRRLAAGDWAVRVHGVPWAGQAVLLAWLEARALHWYATSTRPDRV